MTIDNASGHKSEDEWDARDCVVLVDENDREIGVADKLMAHRGGGQLHRAFSIFIFDGAGKMLLQQRAASKYHFAGLWTNACCSHPQPGENLADAVRARLCFEMGFQTGLREVFSFVYEAHDAQSGLMEREFDHVFSGHFEGEPNPNPQEVGAWKWLGYDELRADLDAHPGSYTPWFRIALQRMEAFWPGRVREPIRRH